MQTRTLFNKRVSGLWMAGAFVLLAIIFVVRVLSPSEKVAARSGRVLPLSLPAIPEAVKRDTLPVSPRRVHQRTPAVFDTEAFYRTIIDNNLFRPLGWTPPRPTEPYRLIGTILPRAANTPPRAILQSTAGNTTHIVTTGEKIDALTEVVSIQGKQVVLSTNGQQRTLHLSIGF